MRIAVTGARSRGGAVIARRLESAGHTVRAGTHSRPRGYGAHAELETCPTAECLPFDVLRSIPRYGVSTTRPMTRR